MSHLIDATLKVAQGLRKSLRDHVWLGYYVHDGMAEGKSLRDLVDEMVAGLSEAQKRSVLPKGEKSVQQWRQRFSRCATVYEVHFEGSDEPFEAELRRVTRTYGSFTGAYKAAATPRKPKAPAESDGGGATEGGDTVYPANGEAPTEPAEAPTEPAEGATTAPSGSRTDEANAKVTLRVSKPVLARLRSIRTEDESLEDVIERLLDGHQNVRSGRKPQGSRKRSGKRKAKRS